MIPSEPRVREPAQRLVLEPAIPSIPTAMTAAARKNIQVKT